MAWRAQVEDCGVVMARGGSAGSVVVADQGYRPPAVAGVVRILCLAVYCQATERPS